MSFFETAYVIFAYFIGAIPTGYLITRATAKKNILQVGWRKTSGSNVFHNVGKWQGIATILIDIAKGFLAVRLGQELGFTASAVIASGVAAIVGNNWSIFISFAGGRGLAVFGGGLLAFSPLLLAIGAGLMGMSAVIWTASFGTLLAIVAIIYYSLLFNNFSTAGLFTVWSLIPIILKRLSPWRELSLQKPSLIFNRLVFDDDTPNREWRVKKLLAIFKK